MNFLRHSQQFQVHTVGDTLKKVDSYSMSKILIKELLCWRPHLGRLENKRIIWGCFRDFLSHHHPLLASCFLSFFFFQEKKSLWYTAKRVVSIATKKEDHLSSACFFFLPQTKRPIVPYPEVTFGVHTLSFGRFEPQTIKKNISFCEQRGE